MDTQHDTNTSQTTTTPTPTTRTATPTRKARKTPTQPIAPVLGAIPTTPAPTAPLTARTVTPASLPPFVIDRADTGVYNHAEPGQEWPTEAEAVLIEFLRGNNTLPAIFADDPAEVANMLSANGGSTIESIFREYHQYRAARRQLCRDLAQFIEAVNTDEARRDEAEANPIQPAQEQAAIICYYDRANVRRYLGEQLTRPDDGPIDAKFTAAELDLTRILRGGDAQKFTDEHPEYIRERLEEGDTIATIAAGIQAGRDDRRAFYEEVKRFINDPATWAALDTPTPDVAAIAAKMGVEDRTANAVKVLREVGSNITVSLADVLEEHADRQTAQQQAAIDEAFAMSLIDQLRSTLHQMKPYDGIGDTLNGLFSDTLPELALEKLAHIDREEGNAADTLYNAFALALFGAGYRGSSIDDSGATESHGFRIAQLSIRSEMQRDTPISSSVFYLLEAVCIACQQEINAAKA